MSRRSFLPPRARLNNTLRYPQVLCIISQHLCFTFFYKVLPSAYLSLVQCAKYAASVQDTCKN